METRSSELQLSQERLGELPRRLGPDVRRQREALFFPTAGLRAGLGSGNGMAWQFSLPSRGMNEEARRLIDLGAFGAHDIQRLIPLLPESDEELDGWLGESVRAGDQAGFVWVALAALAAERPVEARHLARGLQLIPGRGWAMCVGLHVRGEVGPAVLEALETTLMSPEVCVSALLVAADWYAREREGKFPPALIAEAKRIARRQDTDAKNMEWLLSTASMLGDEGLFNLLGKVYQQPVPEMLRQEETRGVLARAILDQYRQSVRDSLPTGVLPKLAEGRTMRRAVERVGRNEACPCGSGQKYKRCCMARDEERLRCSSEVAGITREELRGDMERHLTKPRLAAMLPFAVAQLDATKMPPELVADWLNRLAAQGSLDEAVRGFEALGFPPGLDTPYYTLVMQVQRLWRPDLAPRLVQVGPLPEERAEEELHPGLALLLVQDDAESFLRQLEKIAQRMLESAGAEGLAEQAMAMLFNRRTRALGILVARSIIPIANKQMALLTLEHMLQTRDAIGLPPEDPFEDVIERRFAEEGAGKDAGSSKDAAKLRDAQAKLEAKAAETRGMQEKLEAMKRELALREKRTAAETAKAAAPTGRAVEGERAGELRGRIEELKGLLKERQAERSELRRALEAAHADLETLRLLKAEQAPVAPPDSVHEEEGMTMPVDLSDHQPVRLVEFPPKFHQHLQELPRQTSRAAMVMLGRLAGGEPAAFEGIVMLKQVPDTLRVRIGIDHRLLFRLLPDRVQVVDLINRRDLDRRLKTL